MVCLHRAYSPRHRFLAALVFALMKHVAEVPSAGDFVMAAEELAMLLDGKIVCVCVSQTAH